MSSAAVVITLGILSGASAALVLLAAAFLCRRAMKRRWKARLRDDLKANRRLMQEIIVMSEKGLAREGLADTVTVPAPQQAVEREGADGNPPRDHERATVTGECPVTRPSPCTAEDDGPTSGARPGTPGDSIKQQRLNDTKKIRPLSTSLVGASLSSLLPTIPSRLQLSPTSKPPRRTISHSSMVNSSEGSSAASLKCPDNPVRDTDEAKTPGAIVDSTPPLSRTVEGVDDDERPGSDAGVFKQRRSLRGRASGPVLLHYGIYYSTAESTLAVTVRGAAGLPGKYGAGCASFVRAYLRPRAAGYLQTSTVRQSLDPAYNDHLQFGKISLEEVWANTLRFKLYVTGQWPGGNPLCIGGASKECAALIGEADEVYEVTEELQRRTHSKWRKRSLTAPDVHTESASESLPTRSPLTPSASESCPGDLFVSVQYQQAARRFKVMVRKADGLSSDGAPLLGTQAYCVCVNLLRGERAVIQNLRTRTLTGARPSWNQPFLLHLGGERDLAAHSIEFVLLRVGLPYVNRATPIGRAVVGPRSQGSGAKHWEEVVRPRLTEVTRWHHLHLIEES